MKIRHLLLALALLALAPRAALAGRSDPPEKGFFFIQMADPQFGMWVKNADTVREEENFRKAVEHVNRLRPAFVVISGDIVNIPHDKGQIATFWKIARTIRPDIPLYLVPGNHDVGTGKLDESIAAYERDMGTLDHYVFPWQGSRFIVLDSNVITNAKDNPEREKAQREWFQGQLELARAAGTRHIVVLTHHPWFLAKPGEKDDYFNVPLKDRTWYLDRMRENGVELALAGHFHMEAHGSDGPLKMVTTGPVGMPLGKDPSGFRIVKVTADRIETHYYGLDQVPERVEIR